MNSQITSINFDIKNQPYMVLDLNIYNNKILEG